MNGDGFESKKGMVKHILIFSVIFMLGWSVSALYDNISALSLAEPGAIVKGDFNGVFKAKERISPADHVTEDKIHVYNDRVIIELDNALWAEFTDTNSMDPVLDVGSNAIEIVPNSPSQLEVGDIVSYKSDYADGTVIHRIVEISEDSEGWYARMKGDNNPEIDPGKIRFDQIKRLVVAVIY